MSLLETLRRNSSAIKLSLLICLFGTGSWVEINGIWVELPLLVSQSPQQWSLPSYLTVVIQLANIGPILYVIANKYVKRNGRKIVTEIPTIYGILSVGVLASFLLAFLWDKTTLLGGRAYSTALIVLSFFLATVDCTSSLTFLPFMSYFPQKYMTAFYVGEGFSGFLPSVVALIQGVGEKSYNCEHRNMLRNVTMKNDTRNRLSAKHVFDNSSVILLRNVTEIVPSYFSTEPRFSVGVFFVFISVMMLFSLLSFAWLVRIKQRESSVAEVAKKEDGGAPSETLKMEKFNHDEFAKIKTESDESEHSSDNEENSVTSSRVLFLLVINGLINGLSNGALPALQSYACLPYSFNIYHLTLVLSAFANPLACFLYFFVSLESTYGISVGVVVYVVSAGYTIAIAAMSPCPLLNDSAAGGVVVVST